MDNKKADTAIKKAPAKAKTAVKAEAAKVEKKVDEKKPVSKKAPTAKKALNVVIQSKMVDQLRLQRLPQRFRRML